MTKRKAEDQLLHPPPKKAALEGNMAQQFREGLFDQSTLDTYKTRYSESSP